MDKMKTRASRAKEAYTRKKWKGNEAAFYPTDVYDIVENAEYKETACYVSDALRAGFMIGYRKGLKDAKKASR